MLDYVQVGNAFGQGFMGAVTNSFSNSNMGNEIASSITQIAMGVFNNISANVASNGELGEQLGAKFGEFAKKVIQGSGWNSGEMGSGVGTGINDFLRRLVQDINMKTVTGDFIKEISDAFKEGVTKIDMAGNMDHLGREFNAGLGVFRGNFFKELDLFRSDIQSIFTNMARDTTIKTLPWLALGGAIFIGTPLLTLYLYKKAVHNIGRPLLAQKVRKVGVWDRTTDGATRTVLSIWDAAKVGIKWGALVGTTGLIVSFGGAIASVLMGGRGGIGAQVIDGLACAIGGHYYCNYNSALPLIAATLGTGALRGSISLAHDFYGFVKESLKVDVQPVFNDELQKRIDDLTRSTYNINQNGGYMQNLLLYGPGGTGKTMIAEYIANNSKMNYVMMSGGDLAQHIKRGEHVTELNRLFADAKSSYTPTIVFIDECESLCGDRGKNDRSELTELINAFLNQTGVPSKKVMVILTTNRKEDLDPAVLDRMDHKLYIGLPGLPERKKILELYVPSFMTAIERSELFTESMIASIAEQTEGFTGRAIFKMLNTMSGKRAATNDNMLTEQMVRDTVSELVKQEQEVLGINKPAPEPPITKPSPLLSSNFLSRLIWGQTAAGAA
ncbi:MAG: AAA family ATPase [Verrucomicrobia bacterium]|nr:AAA family ATPase [Verrucomicrobiota bacterium]